VQRNAQTRIVDHGKCVSSGTRNLHVVYPKETNANIRKSDWLRGRYNR
jgi:hypothetical protein